MSKLMDCLLVNNTITSIVLRATLPQLDIAQQLFENLSSLHLLRKIHLIKVPLSLAAIATLTDGIKNSKFAMTHLKLHFCLKPQVFALSGDDGMPDYLNQHDVVAEIYESAAFCHHLEHISVLERDAFERALPRIRRAILRNDALVYAKLHFEFAIDDLIELQTHIRDNCNRWKRLWPTLVDVALAMFATDLPCYVLLEIVDWLRGASFVPQKKKIDLLISVKRSCQNVVARRRK
jgi:hypothetical protein